MKIDLSKEHKNKILQMIDNYKFINKEYQIYNEKIKLLQNELNELTAKLQSTENTLQSFRDDEKIYMEELHSMYGDFTLSDLYESIY
jgi:prefoldin subunit 5